MREGGWTLPPDNTTLRPGQCPARSPEASRRCRLDDTSEAHRKGHESEPIPLDVYGHRERVVLRERDEWERHFWRCRHKLTRARVLLVVAVAAALVGWLR